MAQMLRDNPNVTIEMSSHTDRKGSEAYNIDFSHRRAKSVVDYLIAAGIPADRLKWQGYGKSRPKNVTKRINREYPQFPEADQEAADQINRRTEFQVTSIDYEMF